MDRIKFLDSYEGKNDKWSSFVGGGEESEIPRLAESLETKNLLFSDLFYSVICNY